MTFLALKNKLRSSPIEIVVWLLGIVSLGFSFYATSVGFDNSLFDFHGFRQTQTAIAADSIMHGGGFLHYETPVLGPPWSLPFEFPLYQGIVAGVAKTLSTPLDQTGRFVSILCYFLCFFPLASILSSIGLRNVGMIPPLALFAMSPLYVFVSRLFMIESMAMLFSLLYADQMFRLVLGHRQWPYRHIVGAAVFGVLAGLVKVTTLAPFFALGSCLAAWGFWRDHRSWKVQIQNDGFGSPCLRSASLCSNLGVDQVCRRSKSAKPPGDLPDQQGAAAGGILGHFASDFIPEFI